MEHTGKKPEADILPQMDDELIKNNASDVRNSPEYRKLEVLLMERLKEFNCHNRISEVIGNPNLSVDEICEKIVQLIPEGWQFPDITEVSLEIGGKIYQTVNYTANSNFLLQEITIKGQVIGSIKVCIPDDKLPVGVPLFLAEETTLLFAIAERIGNLIEKVRINNILVESEEKFRTITEQTSDLISITDLNGFIIFASPAAETIFLCSPEKMCGRHFTEFLNEPAVSEAVKEFRLALSKGETTKNLQMQMKRDNGETFFGELNGSKFQTNAQIGTLVTIRDITEKKLTENEIRRLNTNLALKIEERTLQLSKINDDLEKEIANRIQAERELAVEKQRLADIIEGTNVGTWEWNIQTGETIFNERWAGIIGYSLDEISPVSIETWMKFSHPDDLAASGKLLEKHFAGESDYYSAESRMKHKNGEWVWVLDRGKVHQWDQDGKPLLMSGTHQDITEQKRAMEFEKELLQLSVQQTGIPVSDIPSALNHALKRIGSFLSADRAYIFEMDLEANRMNNTFEWCKEGIQPEIQNCQNLPCDHLPKWLELIQRNENIQIPSVQELPESWSTERETLLPQGIQSLIAIPMFIDNHLVGFVGIDYVENKKAYTESEVNILKVWSNMLASLINRRQKDEVIEQTRRNYETFFNTIDDFLFVLNEQGNIIHTNTTVTRRLGYSTAELIDKSVLMVHPAARREEAGRIVGEMLAGTSEFCPVPLVTKSGDQLQVETRVKRGFWDGNPVIFGVTKDVSKLKLSEEKFSKAFQTNSTLMAITTSDGMFMEVNDCFLKTLGYTREEVIGDTSGSLGFFDDPGLSNSLIAKLDSNSPVREVEVKVRTKSGEIRFGLFSADTIYIGKDICFLSMMVDITERKQAEEKMNQAKQEAEKANLAKSEFLSRMSHELRTPMNSILGFAQLMNMGELNPGQKKRVNHILTSGKHLLDLIDDVLDISRIESGKITLVPEPILVGGIITEIMDSVMPLAHARELKLILENSPVNQLCVMSDKKLLKQVLINLLNNAVKYNLPGGSVFIKTTTLPLDDGGIAAVRISVTDTGLGIHPDNIPKIFIPFERVGAEKTQIEGTGLGLAVVKKNMDALKGAVGVESTVGEGSTFWIDLPATEKTVNRHNLQENNLNPAAAPDGPPNEIAFTPISGNSGTILYIEDNIQNAELVEEIIRNHRPEVGLITSVYGNTAVQLAADHLPGLILLDLDLPDIDGSEVLTNLLTDEVTKSIPVVILTADAMPHQINKLLMAGARDYLTKPLDINMFLQVVDEWMEGKK
jgi:PAS domain S-box-containing protein